jgi:hypothetical protein
MDAVLDETANSIEIIPKNISDIHIGDIICYEILIEEQNHSTIAHRVIDIDYDEQGWYATTKGDNAPYPDLEKVRFEQVQSIVIAIIY